MKNRARVGALVACTTLLITGGVGFLQGCGGDDTVVPNPDSGDAADHTSPPDAPIIDSPVAADADADAPVDASPNCDTGPIQQFATDMIKTMCGRYSTCCFPDAATFDEAACEKAIIGGYGWNGANRELNATTFGTCNLVLDQNAATSCLAGLKTFSCPSLSASEQNNTTNNCYGAVYGTIPIGTGGCTYNVECVKGAYCAPAADGGLGTCAALQGQGADCTKTNGIVVNGNYECAYRGYLNETLYCDRGRAPDAGMATGKCQTPLADGKPCINNWDCKSGACGDDSTCGSVTTMTDPVFVCPLFKKDGG